jgi:DNA-binding CsgD family transcriptional regulator
MVEIKFDDDLAYYIGALQGDGGIGRSYKKNGALASLSASITVGKDDYDYATQMEQLIKKIFGCNVSIYFSSNVYRVMFFKRKCIRLIEKYKPSKIPNEVLASKDLLSNYLKGLFDTDGGCNIYKGGKSGVLDFSNNNRSFVYSLKEILENVFGIISNVQTCRKTGYRPVYRLKITNKRNILRFAKSIGFNHPRKKRVFDELVVAYENVGDRCIRNSAQKIILARIGNREVTTNELALELNRHRETIKEHLEKMERANVIKKRVEFYNRWGVVEKSCFRRYCWSVKNI